MIFSTISRNNVDAGGGGVGALLLCHVWHDKQVAETLRCIIMGVVSSFAIIN